MLIVVNAADLAYDCLGEPDRHGVIHAEVPPGFEGYARAHRNLADAALFPGRGHLFAVIRPWIGRLKRAVILLLDHVLRHSVLALGLRECLIASVFDRQQLREPGTVLALALAGHVVERVAVVFALCGVQKERPAAVLAKDRPQVIPADWIGALPFRVHDADRV